MEVLVLAVNFTPNISSIVGLFVLGLGFGFLFPGTSLSALALLTGVLCTILEAIQPVLVGDARFIASDLLVDLFMSSLGSLLVYFIAAWAISLVARFIAGRRKKKRVFSRSS